MIAYEGEPIGDPLPEFRVPAYETGYPEEQPPLLDEDQLEEKETPFS